MKQIAIILFSCFFLFSSLQAKIPTVDESELVSSKRLERATEVILHILEAYHYKKTKLDDDMSASIYQRYLDNLDPNRSFFTQKELEIFEPFRYKIDNALKRSKLEPAYIIFRSYRSN